MPDGFANQIVIMTSKMKKKGKPKTLIHFPTYIEMKVNSIESIDTSSNSALLNLHIYLIIYFGDFSP